MKVKIVNGEFVSFREVQLIYEHTEFIKKQGSHKGKNYLIFSCSKCSKDSELWPLGSIRCLPCEIKRGIPPCGCKKSIVYKEHQNRIRVKRKCESLGYEFLGWDGNYTTIHKTGVKFFDKELKVYSKFSSIVTFLLGKGLTQERQNELLVKRNRTVSEEEVVNAFKVSGNYKEGTSFKLRGSNISGYWSLRCPVCSCDDIVGAGLCTGIFNIAKGDLDKGVTPCRCSSAYRWTEAQREFLIKNKLKTLDATWDGWLTKYNNRSSKFKWICSQGHNPMTSVLTFFQGTGCAECYKENKCYGYYPHRLDDVDSLYLIKMSNGFEVFYKIGRSFDVNKRISTFNKYYNCEIISVFKNNHERIYMLEQCLHKLVKGFHYTPDTPFKGSVSECFTSDLLEVEEVRINFDLH